MVDMSERLVPIKGGQVHQLVWDTPDPTTGLTLHFAHANGFCASTYIDLLAPLAPHFRIIASDLRGHGRTTLPAVPSRHKGWQQYARDINRTLDEDRQRWSGDYILAGHSLGGASSLLAAKSQPERIRGMFLTEPVIIPYSLSLPLSFMNALRTTRLPNPMAKVASGRRPHFKDADEAFSSYRGRGAFKTWPDNFLQNYLRDGLVPDDTPGHHGMKLACHPLWEAENFKTVSPNVWSAIKRLTCPIHILHGEHQSTCKHAARRIKSFGHHVTIDRIPGTSHFLPMEKPDLIQETLLTFAHSL